MGGKDDVKAVARPPVSARPPVPPPSPAIDDRPGSPLVVLQQISEEAVRVANEAIQSVRNGHSGGPDGGDSPSWGGKQSPSESPARGHRRSNSLQNLKSQIQRAWRWRGTSQEENGLRNFNPEELANQKREWYKFQSKTPDRKKFKEATVLFEYFIVAGLRPEANLEVVEEAFAKRKKLELEMARADKKNLRHQIPSPPPLEPQMLFKYPPEKQIPMRSSDLCAFCFPGGVKARLVERTPSLSDLNELVYGGEHLGKDTSAFIFSLKGADNATLYGVCLLVPEIVQRPPGILGGSSPIHHAHAASRYLVSAPRCYCLLTRVPFFEFHYEMLNSIVAQERLNRITQFVSEISVFNNIPSNWGMQGQINAVGDFPEKDSLDPLMSSAIPVDSTVVLAAAAAGIIPDDGVESSLNKDVETQSPPSITASRGSYTPAKETDRDDKDSQYSDDHVSDVSEQPNGFETSYESSDNGMFSPGHSVFSRSGSPKLERSSSSLSLFSSARSLEDEDYAYMSSHESEFSGDFMSTQWTKESGNDFLKILSGYSALPIPARGSEVVFQPLEHLQAIQYRRPAVSDLGLGVREMELESEDLADSAEVNAKLAVAEDAFAVSVWTTATICRVLSLDNILVLLAGVLLEKQVAVTCANLPKSRAADLNSHKAHNLLGIILLTCSGCGCLHIDSLYPDLSGITIVMMLLLVENPSYIPTPCPVLAGLYWVVVPAGVLSAVVLSLAPMIRPFEWQSLLLPVLPGKMIDFIEAPVPFLVGLDSKPSGLKIKTSNLVYADIAKDQLKTCYLPVLPRRKELAAELHPIHAKLASQSSTAERHPVYKCSEVQAEAAMQFLEVMRRYMESLCADLRSYTITSVQSNNDRVSILLKDSFIDSFPYKDRPFIKLFTETQMFTVLSDSRLSKYEHQSV